MDFCMTMDGKDDSATILEDPVDLGLVELRSRVERLERDNGRQVSITRFHHQRVARLGLEVEQMRAELARLLRQTDPPEERRA